MSAHNLVPLVAFLFNIILIFLVLRRNWTSFLHRIFSLFLFVLALWALGIFGMRSSPDVEHAYFWEKAVIIVGPSASVFFFHFTLLLTRTNRLRGLLPTAYAVMIAFIPFSAIGLVVSGMQLKPYGYAPVLGLLFYPWILCIYFFLLMGAYNLIKSRKYMSAEERNRSAYIISGVGFYILSGTTDILPVIGIPMYPLGMIGNIVFCLLATIAILRHNLLDIRIVLRKGTAYVLTSAVAAVPFIVIFLIATRIFTEGEFPSWAYFIVAIVLAFALPHLWQWVQQGVNRWFYRDRYDYLKALETFSQQTQSITGSVGLGSTMVNLLAKALRSSNVYLLQPLPPDDDLTMVSTNGNNNPAPAIRLKKESAIVKWLERSDSMLSYKDIEIIPQLQGTTSKDKQILQQVSADLISPLKAHTGQLSGILILSKKLSEQPYNSEDKQLIYTICNHMSTNLENMRLYNESQHEVEERKQAEKALKESEEFSTSLLANSPNPMLVINQDTSVKYANPALEKLTGFSPLEIISRKTPYPWWTEETLKKTAKDLDQAMLRGARRLEELFQKKNGERFWVEITSTPVTSNGKFKYYLANWVDITERKRAEEREKEMQQELLLSSRLASIGELAAGVAHQLNNPLTGILGFSQRILRKVTDQETSQDLRKIYGEAERAAKIVQNLLTFARRRQPKKEYSDVNNVVQSALELRAYELKTSNIEVTTKLAPSLPKIMLDFHQMQEVFLNLILNAEQAMTEANGGGKLIIKTEKNKEYVRCTFSDDGPGIPPENLDNVFDPFFTTKGEKGGTGLGLSVCHGIITEHGGRIYANSKPNKGASFFVELPITTKE